MFKIFQMLGLALLLISNVASAASPGYYLLDNGQIFTVSEESGVLLGEGFIQDGSIAFKGSNYIITQDSILYSVSSDGYVKRDRHHFNGERVVRSGGIFFITRDGQAHVVKNNGEIVRHDGSQIAFQNARISGGTFFLTKYGRLFMANPLDGKIYQDESYDGYIYDAVALGHNYFATKDGTIYTFSFSEGEVKTTKTKSEVYQDIQIAGGVFFFDKEGSCTPFPVRAKSSLKKVLDCPTSFRKAMAQITLCTVTVLSTWFTRTGP